MNRIIIVLIFVVIANSIKANCNDSAKAYDYWSKKAIIEMLYAYMEDFDSLKYYKLSPGEKKGMNSFKDKFLKESFDTNLFDEKEISDFLKNNEWNSLEKNIFQKLLRYYKNDSLLKHQILFEKITKEKYPEFYQKQNDNKKSYEKCLQNIYEKQLAEKQLNETPVKGRQVEKEEKIIKNNKQGFLNYLLDNKTYNIYIFLISFLLGMYAFYLITKVFVKNIIGRNYYHYKENGDGLSFFAAINYLKIRKDELKENENKKTMNQFNNSIYKNEYDKLKIEYDKLKSELERINKNKNYNSDISDTNINKTIIKNTEKIENSNIKINDAIKPEVESAFFSIPSNERIFTLEQLKTSNDGKCLYKIEYNNKTGKLIYISGALDNKAIEQIDSYLKRACDIENFENRPNAKKVEQITPGKVELRDDAWHIVEKIKVRLI